MIDRLTVLEVITLAAWIGAVALFGAVVAPAAFAALPSRALAGGVIGRVLPSLFLAGIGVGLLVVASAVATRAGPARLGAGGVLVLACAISHLVIGARIGQLRQVIGPSLEAVAVNDPQRLLFARLHALSVAGLGLGTLAAAVALWMASSSLRRAPPSVAAPGGTEPHRPAVQRPPG